MEETKLCGKCKKPKGETPECCNCGRPTTYKEEYIGKVDEYLLTCVDEVKEVVKYQGENSTGYEQKWKVRLPTIEGFSRYIDVDKTSLYEWEKVNIEFAHALRKIRIEQQERLINAGLSGDYNSTIAKLILSSNHGMREKGDITTDGKAIKGNGIIFTNFKDEL